MAEGILGRDLWAESLWAGERIGPTMLAEFRTVEYQLELRTSANALVSILRNFDNPEWTLEVNRPDSLTFTYPARDDDVQYFAKPYQIWLRDSVTGTLLQRFKIIHAEVSGVAPDIVNVFCQDFLIQLGQEWIESYVKTVTDGLTFRQILQGYLDHQANTNKLSIGSMSSTLANRQTNTNATNKTVLNAIETIHNTIGGFYHCNWARRIDWKVRLTPNRGQQFRRRKNMKGIKAKTRYDEIVNRMYAYGHGSTRSTRLNLIDAGEANEYIDDAASIAAYGIHCGSLRDSSIVNAAELLAKAQARLAIKKDPRVDYTIDIVDLSQSALNELAYEEIYLGSPRRIIDEELGISTLQNVVKIVHDLKNPLNVRVVLANLPRNITALWKRVVREQQLAQEDAESPYTDTDAFEETLEDVLSITDAPTEIATWESVGDTGTLDGLMVDAIQASEPTMTGLGDLCVWDEVGNDGNLDEKIEDVLAITDTTEICTWETAGNVGNLDNNMLDVLGVSTPGIAGLGDVCIWNDAAETGNLDTHIADMMNHDQTPVLTAVLLPAPDTAAGAIGTGTRGARDDHEHPRSTLYPRMYRQTTAPGGTLYGGDLWEDTNDGSGPSGENQIYIYEAGNTSWVPFLLLT